MTPRSALEERLARLAEAGVAGADGRVLRAADGHALRRRLLRHLDAVVLPRSLDIAVGERGLRLDLANRRILRVEAPETTLEGAEVTSTAVARTVDSVLADATSAALRVGPPSGAFDPSRAGISVATLAGAMGVSLDPAEVGAGAMEALLARARSISTAWLMQSEGVLEGAGPDDLTARLRSRMPAAAGDAEPWRLLALCWTDGQGAVFVLQGEARLALAVEPGAFGQIADFWRDLVAG